MAASGVTGSHSPTPDVSVPGGASTNGAQLEEGIQTVSLLTTFIHILGTKVECASVCVCICVQAWDCQPQYPHNATFASALVTG